VRPIMTFFSIATISMAWSGRIVKGWTKLDELTRTLSSPIPSSTRTIFSSAGSMRSTDIDGSAANSGALIGLARANLRHGGFGCFRSEEAGAVIGRGKKGQSLVMQAFDRPGGIAAGEAKAAKAVGGRNVLVGVSVSNFERTESAQLDFAI
jgi:hypothetical protein